jgi:hypothetical protein
MNTCFSCKNKTSNDRCTSKSIQGLTLCGRHVKSKSPRLWHIVNNLDAKITLISRMWRGHAVRIRLRNAGPGVLKRSLCHNDEELVSMDSKLTHPPFDFFSFVEGDKIWWFDIRSILSCLNASTNPTNPYTRQPLTIDTRRRLRNVFTYRLRNKLPTLCSPAQRSFQDIVELYWLRACQVLHENGFEDVNPNLFLRMTKTQCLVFTNFLVNDLLSLAIEHPASSTRYRYAAIMKRERDIIPATSYRTIQMQVSGLVASFLHDMVDPYPFCFVVMSALHRL